MQEVIADLQRKDYYHRKKVEDRDATRIVRSCLSPKLINHEASKIYPKQQNTMGCNASRAANVEAQQGPTRRGRIQNRQHTYDLASNTFQLIEQNRIPIFRRSNTAANHLIDLDGSYRIQRRAANLDLLRSEMLSLERVFQTLLEQHFEVASNHNRDNGSYPPASPDAIENLPTIIVSHHDFEDGCNKECSICFQEFNVGDTVSRLPCGHLYHGCCISEWLNKKCTCPICRWELETEDRLFEIERIQRMKNRRIRINDHELDRLCIQGLQELAGTRDVNRAKLIQQIKNLDNVEVITNNNRSKCCEEGSHRICQAVPSST